jgi:hypothetical protein
MPEPPSLNRLQFRVLCRVFLFRVVDLELLSAQGDSVRLLGQFASLFAAVSFFFTAPLILIGGRLPQELLWTMAHLLIASTMLVAGLFSALTWDSIFPDRRDILILAPLPIPARTIFLAKLTASIAALGLAILALNVFTGLVWPFLFSAQNAGPFSILRSIPAYWATMLAAAAFIFCSVLALQSVTAQLLPRQLFLRLSAILQVVAVCLFLGVYLLEPSLESITALTAPENQRLLAWSPTYWFLGLFQQLNGSMQPAFAPLATRAKFGLIAAVVIATASTLFSYLRTLRKTIEEPDILPAARRTLWSPRLANPLQSAIFLFTARTLFRSRQHRMLLSFYLGIEFAVVLGYLGMDLGTQLVSHRTAAAQALEQSIVPLFAASLLIVCLAVTGVRMVSSMPVALRSNWIFRLTETHATPAYLAALRRTFLLLACLPVWGLSAILFVSLYPLRLAIPHLIVLALLGVILTELCLYRVHKIPFTCSYLPGKANMQYAFWAVVALLPLTYAAARLEAQALHRVFSCIAMVLLLCAAAAAARWRTSASIQTFESLSFDESPNPEILSLGIRTDGQMMVNSLQPPPTAHPTTAK